MDWSITHTQDQAAWFDDYVRDVVSSASPELPPHDFNVGKVQAHWHQVAPGFAFVAALGESILDEIFVEDMLSISLANHGYDRARMAMYWDHSIRNATWDDVYNKARRLVQTGCVTLLRNGYRNIQASVKGDHGTYDVEIKREDPSSRAITGSSCGCDWGEFQNTPRTRIWKRFQDRPCSHIIAAYWQSLATPLDEDRAPGNFGQPGQMALPGMGGPMSAPSTMPIMKQRNMEQMQAPDASGGAPTPSGPQGGPQAPPPESVLPQFPMDPALQPPHNPISTPGGKPQSPLNPAQYPQGQGGTWSSWRPGMIRHVFSAQQYTNGDRVQLLNEDVGTLVGRSEAHGAGQPFTIPKGQIGEVLGTHPSTGMVNVLYMGKPWDKNGPMEPYGATCWHWPSDIKLRNDIRAPGPNVQRSRPLR